ncbi:hypothetical protein X943_001006 [Babesia divergens]|uniref:Uncharacterized protein n=1 Tax=Babesia divergens TaxID=32595 RepID=A0AAD9LJJ2_BABDI|nr:hypothetical protein X943_001006 [Babesia divergens]
MAVCEAVKIGGVRTGFGTGMVSLGMLSLGIVKALDGILKGLAGIRSRLLGGIRLKGRSQLGNKNLEEGKKLSKGLRRGPGNTSQEFDKTGQGRGTTKGFKDAKERFARLGSGGEILNGESHPSDIGAVRKLEEGFKIFRIGVTNEGHERMGAGGGTLAVGMGVGGGGAAAGVLALTCETKTGDSRLGTGTVFVAVGGRRPWPGEAQEAQQEVAGEEEEEIPNFSAHFEP